MAGAFPGSVSEFLEAGYATQAELQAFKSASPLPDYGWHPYDSLSALPVVGDLMAAAYQELGPLMQNKPVADLGCGDGDWAMLFSGLGAANVDAIDHRESNYNQMRGAEALRQHLRPAIQVHDVDLDDRFELPREEYGFTLFLGTLYHLKNPFYVLEKLAAHSDWCLISTRIAQVTPAKRTPIATEPVAYILASREANNDPTNYWVSSPTGLVRLLERTGWMVMGHHRAGCRVDSDPVNPEADERMFVLLKSRTRHPELHVRPLDGWHDIEEDQWRWTAKRFSVEVTLPETERAVEFALRFQVPDAVLSAQSSVRVACHANSTLLGTIQCESAEPIEFRGTFPPSAAPGSALKLDFSVDSSYEPASGDARDLGLIVPLLESSHRHTQRLPFRIS